MVRSAPCPDFDTAFNEAGLTWSEFRTVREAVETDADLSPDNPMFADVMQPGIGHPGPRAPCRLQRVGTRRGTTRPEAGPTYRRNPDRDRGLLGH